MDQIIQSNPVHNPHSVLHDVGNGNILDQVEGNGIHDPLRTM